ncbi:mitotic spindle assembly checkpoint protein MAD2B [Drosophila pseudoobscura]|uniref:Mitotic spindle assembly checkpoint protein MAD2B n=1 Tax=Drosophila pseudoobscura pseudoobscura TaxID=46245 RepID=A0A6I8UR34_DROPS|nr:mitotic spindle assembly checkpoint protein MAD2B [Drosophila pseudoobscura]
MQSEYADDIHLEALEVILNHILYVRGIYPAQIFKKRRIYNTPIFVSIYPPLNTYLAGVLRSARELLCRRELKCFEILLYHSENTPIESYMLQIEQLEPEAARQPAQDPHLIEYEQHLRAALYKLSERLKPLPRLPGNCQFKVHLHTTQTAFVEFSHEAQYQEFPWLQAETPQQMEARSGTVSLLPLVAVDNVGLKMQARIFG